MYGFKKVIGIEFSARLCAVARKNVAMLPKVAFLRSPIEIIEQDVVFQPVSAEMNVFYIYNSIRRGRAFPTAGEHSALGVCGTARVWLIYNTPRYHETIDQSGLFQGCSLHEIGGTEFKVYSA